MKKVLKFIAYAYLLYVVVSLVNAATIYIYGRLKYGSKTMNEAIKFSFDCYKVTIANMLHNLKENRKMRKSPYYVLLKDAKDWEEEFN